MKWRALFIFILLLYCAASFGQNTKEQALLNQAYTAYNNQQYAESSKILEQVLKISPKNPSANYFLGVCQYQLGQPEKAIPPLETAVAAPNPPEGSEVFLASVYVATDQIPKAVPLFKDQYRKDPDNADVAYQYAAVLKANEDYPEALAVYRDLLKDDGKYADVALYDMGEIFTTYESYGQAVKMFHRIPVGSPYGEAASAYIKNLNPSIDYFSVYLSQEFFYNDNPGSAGTSLTSGQTTPSIKGSSGGTLVASISSRNIELTHKLRLSFNLLHYSINYQEPFATQYDFNGNYLNPYLHYIIDPSTSLHLENAYEYIHYNNQFMKQNYKSRLVLRRATGRNSLQLLCGIQNLNYTDEYKNTKSSIPVSLEYQNGNTLEIGAGGSIYFPKHGINVQLNYEYNAFLPDKKDDAVVGDQASDKEHRDHVFSGNITIPLPGWFKRVSLNGNIQYSFDDYINTQSGQTYASAAGKSINIKTLGYGGKVRVLLLKEFNLALDMGAEHRTVDSQAKEAEYEVDRTYMQISANF